MPAKGTSMMLSALGVDPSAIENAQQAISEIRQRFERLEAKVDLILDMVTAIVTSDEKDAA